MKKCDIQAGLLYVFLERPGGKLYNQSPSEFQLDFIRQRAMNLSAQLLGMHWHWSL
jgi:hypothetical protein